MAMKRPADAVDQLVGDVQHVINFCCRRRSSHADVRDACRSVLNAADIGALRFLLDAIESRGSYGVREYRTLARLRLALALEDQRNALIEKMRAASTEWRPNG